MRKIYHLKSCSTCVRILKELNLETVELVNIKIEPIIEADLDFIIEKLGSIEPVFSKRAMKYRSLGLHEMDLSEQDMKDWILKEYTFIKRPLAIIDEEIYSGSAKKVIESLKAKLNE